MERMELQVDYERLGLRRGDNDPHLTLCLWRNLTEYKTPPRPTVVVVPGGGYGMVSQREADCVALGYQAAGFQVLILNYSVQPSRYPTQLVELATAVKTVKEHADAWNCDPSQVYVAGFSAGGHLACSLGVLWNDAELNRLMGCDAQWYRPAGMILSYPVISYVNSPHVGSFDNLCGSDDALKRKLSLETRVTEDTVPAFLWHTAADDCVPVQNSLVFASALSEQKIPFECHIYPVGRHGLSLANDVIVIESYYAASGWHDLSVAWIKNRVNPRTEPARK